MTKRTQSATILLILLLVGAVPALSPGVEAQAPGDVKVSDGPGDVALMPPTKETQDTPTPATYPEGMKSVDLTEVRLYGETPTEFWLGFSVLDFTRPNAPAGTFHTYVVCFDWDTTGSWYRLWVKLEYPLGGGEGPAVKPKGTPAVRFDQIADASACTHTAFVGSDNDGRMPVQYIEPVLDIEGKTFDVRIPRIGMEEMAPANEPRKPVPMSGGSFGNLQARSTAHTGSSIYHAFDMAGPASDRFTFQTDTGNSVLRVNVEENVNGASNGVEETGGVPIYGVETGSFQTVPIVIENHLPEPLDVNITATVLDATDKGAWDLRVIPNIPVAGKVGDKPGVETVTLIVHTDPSISHKDRARVLVSATDPRHPGLLGAGLVDVLGVQPPTASENQVHFHSTGRTCTSAAHWINTLAEDPKATASELLMRSCDIAGGGEGTVAGASGITFRPDVPFARDYTLSVTEPAKGQVGFKAVAKLPGQDQEAPTSMVADVVVTLTSGGQLLGEAVMTNQHIDAAGTVLPFEIHVDAPLLGAKGREVPNDRPLAIRVSVDPQDRTFVFCSEACQPLPEEERTVPDPSAVAGRFYMLMDKSHVTLPIVDSRRSGDLINTTASGALISLRLADPAAEKSRFTNPGKTVVYNVTVRNEGVNVDTATIDVSLNATGWRAEILPVRSYKLAIGEGRSFNIRVVAPEEAREGERLGLKVKATSKVDPEAVAILPFVIEITHGVDFADDVIDENLQKVDKTEESPSPVLLPLLALVGLAAWLGRRRRR
ncbi:MAG: hypothetical protein KY455_10830 [Euryarchaeota archaeon]|nr:hypothetical protein [Euryarchaeota archaeon]